MIHSLHFNVRLQYSISFLHRGEYSRFELALKHSPTSQSVMLFNELSYLRVWQILLLTLSLKFSKFLVIDHLQGNCSEKKS